VLREYDVPANSVRFFDDWCPNRTRHVTCEARYVTPQVLVALVGLLRRKYEFWRVEVIIVRDLEKDDEQGMIALQRNWVLCYGSGRQLVTDVKRVME
jgi:hypothetical protein